MRLLVKYCGGCNVFYDRPGLVETIRQRFPALEITFEGDEADLVAVLCGCPTACLPHGHVKGRLGKWVVTGPREADQLLEALEDLVPGV